MTVLFIILGILAFIILWQIFLRLIRRFVKFPAPAFMGGLLDSGLRKRMEPPARVIAGSGIKPGMQVLEIGCGPGTFTLDAARAAAEKGKVYALDIQEDMLKQLQRKLSLPENYDIKNIEFLNNSAYELPLEDNSLDLVFMVTVFQEIPDKQRALSEFKRVLKPSAILAISEWIVDPDYPWTSTTRRMAERGGFVYDGFSGNRWNYTVRFRKPC
jgi:ubiquinone/menaquinone biosynthesis C-methylase UbiE